MELAEIAYKAYGDSTGHKNFLGDLMPEFKDLPPSIKEAWKAAANAVIEYNNGHQ